MKLTNRCSITSFFTISVALLTVSSAANPKDTKPAASRAEKSYTQHAYGSNDYDTDYYAGKLTWKKHTTIGQINKSMKIP